jgi:hypothetical protein
MPPIVPLYRKEFSYGTLALIVMFPPESALGFPPSITNGLRALLFILWHTFWERSTESDAEKRFIRAVWALLVPPISILCMICITAHGSIALDRWKRTMVPTDIEQPATPTLTPEEPTAEHPALRPPNAKQHRKK